MQLWLLNRKIKNKEAKLNKLKEKERQEIERKEDNMEIGFFNLDKIESIASRKAQPKIKDNIHGHKYGEDKKIEYEKRFKVVELVIKYLRKNNLTRRKEWEAYKIPVEQVMRDFYKASKEYADVLRFYAKKEYEAKQRLFS